MKKTLVGSFLISIVFFAGCSSSITAISLTDDSNTRKAIPYYLPQPYLLVTRDYSHTSTKITKKDAGTPAKPQEKGGGSSNSNKEKKAETTKPEATTTTEPVSVAVKGFTYKIIYLPDLKEKYGLVYKSGSGESEMSFSLKDGWMFTGLNHKSDTQIDETITAIGGLVGSIAKLPPAFRAIPIEQADAGDLNPAIWLFKMTLDTNNAITFKPVPLKGLTPEVQ